MADVSGFTALSEKYNNFGKGGTYRLTVTLNTYIGSLVELIYSHGGDILKFAGDAFLALWKTDKRAFLSHTIHTAIACALIIQHSYSSYETDVKVSLKVKLAISAGNLIFAPIGTGIDMNYVMIGLPVLEAKLAESLCSSGEVKLTPNAWAHCYSRNYDHIVHNDGHVTIKSILYDPHEKDVTRPFLGFSSMTKQMKRPFSALENLPDTLWNSSSNLSAADVLKKNDALELRKTILQAEENNIGSEIRKFMIRPVLTQIDAHQPLEYLTEMRLVSILFLTLKPRDCPFPQLVTIVNNAYQITCEIVYKSMGCVNKIILFDKDIMILVVFGLRGFKHESEAEAALKCGYSIRRSLSALDGVQEVSVGVTTGQVYCGVVGHPLRREFTVIGAIVNKAARLMCKFRNKVTCDETTFIKSKMSSNGFTLQPETELKGIGNVGKIYEYTEEMRVKELYDIPTTQPLLDRSDEMEYFQSWLEDCHSTLYRDFDALLLVGEARIGKSRLLEWMARHARNKEHRVCYICLSSIHSATPYLALSQIINRILGLKEPISGFIKEEKVVQLLQVYSEDLCYLNNIIKVRFAYHEGIYLQDEKKRKDKGKVIFSKLIAAIQDIHVIFLDDLQNLDQSSWEFISLMFCSMKIFFVMTVTRGKYNSVNNNWLYSAFINDSVRKIVLGALESVWVPALACQILDVAAVPKNLCDALISKCNGLPGLVESFITHLISNGALELKKIPENEKNDFQYEDLVYPKNTLLHPEALDTRDQDTLDDLLQQNLTEDISICIVINKNELNTNINVQNLDALIMIQIDSLTPYQQLLLKIASVIGNVLSRALLESIMYENNWLTTAKAIKRLFAMRILACATLAGQKYNSQGSSSTTSHSHVDSNLACGCSFEYDSENSPENLPKYAFCKVMRFKNKSSRSTCYELLPINQKKEFHSRIVNYLENNRQKCPTCGGAIMIVQSITSFQPRESINSYNSNDIPKDQSSSSSESQEFSEALPDLKYKDDPMESKSLGRSQSATFEANKIEANLTKPASDAVIHEESHNFSLTNIEMQYTPILKSKPSQDIKSSKPLKRVTMTNFNVMKSGIEAKEPNKIFDMLREVTQAECLSDWHKLGIVDSLDNIDDNQAQKDRSKRSLNITIERGISEINFSKCTCADLNVAIYGQLIHHAIHAELKNKAIEFTITFSYLNLLGDNLDTVFPKLEDAETMCMDNKTILNKFDMKRYLGKIYSLRAAASLTSGRIAGAKIELERALKIYRINLDKVSALLPLKTFVKYFKMKQQNYRINTLLILSDSVFCLNVATLLFSSMGEDRLSKLASHKALQIVQEVECNVVDMCDAYSNAIQVEIDRGVPDATADIENMICSSLEKLSRPITADELYAIGKLFMGTFRGRIARGQLAATIHSGFRVLTVSRFLQADNVALDIIPDLFYVLLARRRIGESIDVLHLVMRLSQARVSCNCETWYYALCMDMILDAGFQLESPHDISMYAEYALSKGKSAGPGRRRLIVNLWTYWLRADSEKKAKRFESEALSWVSNDENDGTFTNTLSAMRLADGMLESLARKVDDLRKVEYLPINLHGSHTFSLIYSKKTSSFFDWCYNIFF